MRTTYTRLYADDNGISHFADVEVELAPGFAAPPADPLHFASFVHLGQSNWVGAAPD
jgi:hypothetical protein